MEKNIQCEECDSLNVRELYKTIENYHMTEESGFYGLGGSYTTNYVENFDNYQKYKCNDCGHEFKKYISTTHKY